MIAHFDKSIPFEQFPPFPVLAVLFSNWSQGGSSQAQTMWSTAE